MKFNLITLFLVLSLSIYSQKNTIEDINKYVANIDSNSELKLNEYDWSKVTGTNIDHGATLKIWKTENQIVKIEEQFGVSYGRYTRLIYLKNEKPLKGIEIEENFSFKNNQIDYSSLDVSFEMQIYVTGFNDIIDEYEFDVTNKGKRKVTEPYCDLNSVFAIIDEIDNL